MKKIEAIIQPHKLDDVKNALAEIGIDGMTILEGRGHGRQKGHSEVYRGVEYKVDLLPKFKIEMVVPEDATTSVFRRALVHARTSRLRYRVRRRKRLAPTGAAHRGAVF